MHRLPDALIGLPLAVAESGQAPHAVNVQTAAILRGGPIPHREET